MRKALAFTLATALGATVAGQQASPRAAPAQPPTFRSNVNAVLLDVRVVDRDGHFVPEPFEARSKTNAKAVASKQVVFAVVP